MKTTVTLLILLTVVSLNTYAQDYTQWGLPDGATARLGKGWISGNYRVFHPTAPGSLWRVVSVYGSTIPQPVKRSPCLQGIRGGSEA